MTAVSLYLTPQEEHNQLLLDDPLALLIGMLLDQQIPMERAFSAPALLKERLSGSLEAAYIASLDPDKLTNVFSQKPALHRFPKSMAARVQQLCSIVATQYNGHAEQIWLGAKTGSELIDNIAKLPGFGEQKAKIFAALLAKRLGVRPEAWQEATEPFGREGTYMSVADSDSSEALEHIRTYKARMKSEHKAANLK